MNQRINLFELLRSNLLFVGFSGIKTYCAGQLEKSLDCFS